MAASTALMGCLPTHDSIGVMAPVLLVLLRIIQGFSLGGELPGAITYLSESVPQRRGFMVGILYMALMLGISLGTFVQGALNYSLGSEVMKDWGWAYPFSYWWRAGGIQLSDSQAFSGIRAVSGAGPGSYPGEYPDPDVAQGLSSAGALCASADGIL